MNFQQPLMLHPLQKHIEGAEDVDGVPLGIFFGGQFRKILKKRVDKVDGIPLDTFFGAIPKNEKMLSNFFCLLKFFH